MGSIHLTFTDIGYAALLALLLTWLVGGITKSFRLIFNPVEMDYNDTEPSKVLKKCYNLFPKDNVLFQGKVYKRGMSLRVTTSQKKVIEGEFVGLNNDDMMCIITSRYVVAHDLNNIEDITEINRTESKG